MTAEVVSLRDNAPIDRGEPNQQVVEFFEKWLAEAKAGTVVAAAVVAVRPADIVGTDWIQPGMWAHHLVSGVSYIAHRLNLDRDIDD